MRFRGTALALCFATATLATTLLPREAHAAAVPPAAERNTDWEIVSTISMVIGVATPSLMPRVYYSDPEATVGWKARWHVSVLAPIFTLTASTLLIDIPLHNLIEGTRPGCSVEETEAGFDGSNCESYAMPSSHAFAAWSAFGAGTGIWVADTFIHSDDKFNAGSFIGNVAVPLTAAIMTTVARGVGPGTAEPYETPEQLLVGFGAGTLIGFGIGIAYGILAVPNCGYGDDVICW
jgi:hypothetical protein